MYGQPISGFNAKGEPKVAFVDSHDQPTRPPASQIPVEETGKGTA